jgi:ubiquitin carboxyl-terminal hydrolase 14
VCQGREGAAASAVIEPLVKSYDLHPHIGPTIEKHSAVLGHNALWTRKQRIARLPPILVVQFGHFYWKATPNSPGRAGVKCKVMKPVTINMIFDVYKF